MSDDVVAVRSSSSSHSDSDCGGRRLEPENIHHHSSVNEETDDNVQEKEIILRYVFLRCDPMVRQLCDLIQTQLRPALSSSSSSLYGGTTSSSSSRRHSSATIMLSLLQQISKALEQLHERIESLLTFVPVVAAESNNNDQQRLLLRHMKRDAVHTLLDYILIPVMTILRTLGEEQYCWKPLSSSSLPPTERSDQLLQSRIWKCVGHSASIVTLLVQTCVIPPDPSTCPTTTTNHHHHHPSNGTTTTRIEPKRLLSYLHACLVAWPRRAVIQQQWGSSSAEAVVATTTSSLLDRGDDCVSRLGTTIQVLIGAMTTTTTTAAAAALPGHNGIPHSCMVRILDSCITFIEPLSSSSHDDPTNATPTTWYGVSTKVQLLAVELIHSLLTIPQPQRSSYSNTTTTTLLTTDTIDWRSAFPGIYTGVYRRILHSFHPTQSHGHRHHAATTTAISQRITWHCITIMTDLLQVCCGRRRYCSKDGGTTQQHAQSISRQLQSWTTMLRAQASSSSSSSPQVTLPNVDGTIGSHDTNKSLTPEEEFINQVQQRIPATLFVLVNGFARVRSTPKIRQQMIRLCRVILIDTHHCWMIESNRYLLLSCLEMVLLLAHDTDADVVQDATAFVTEYLTVYLHRFQEVESSDHHAEYCRVVKGLIGPRILELIERLPSCVQSGRDDELDATLQRILGYLQNVPPKFLRSALTSDSIRQMIRRTFSDVFDVPFELSDPYQLGTIVLNFINHPNSSNSNSNNRIQSTPDQFSKRQYMSETMINLAKTVVQAYGSMIGPKHGIMLVDACIADLYRSCMDRIERQLSTTGRSQIQWTHEWVGTVTFIQCIMRGSFYATVSAEENARKNHAKYRTKYLIPLLRSSLPIITTYPLWDLGNHWSETKESETSTGRSDVHFAVSAFRGNVVMMCALLEFIKESIGLLDIDTIQSFNSMLLYPILDKMSEQYPGAIRETAYHALSALATANQCDDIVTFIVNNIESCLIGPMLSRLRMPGGRSLQPDTPIDYDIICVLDCATTVLRLATDAYAKQTVVESKTKSKLNILLSMEELTTQLTNRFDYASTIVTYDVATCIKYLQLFDTAMSLLQVVYRQHTTTADSVLVGDTTTKNQASLSTSPSPAIDVDAEPWFQLLAPYTKATDDDKLSPKEGFEKFWKEKDDMIRQADAVVRTESLHPTQSVNVQRDIKFCSYIVWRLGYLLSHPNLQVQNRSCDVMTKCFQWLGFLGTSNLSCSTEATTNGEDGASSSNLKPKNAILRQVHSVWPTISTRMKALCTAVLTESDRVHKQPLSLLVLQTSPPSDPSQTNEKRANLGLSGVGEQRLYLSKILQLITAMIENTEDFMYSRFRNEIYPNCILKLLQHYSNHTTRHSSSNTTVPLLSTSSVSRQGRATFTESDEHLLYEVFDCIRRLYRYRPMGQQASTGHLTPTIGQYVLAITFQSNYSSSVCPRSYERIRQIGIDVLGEMIRVDTDALYRPIFQLLSDQSALDSNMIPQCPLLAVQRKTGRPTNGEPVVTDDDATSAPVPNTSVAHASRVKGNDLFRITALKGLFDLMRTLPEQPIY